MEKIAVLAATLCLVLLGPGIVRAEESPCGPNAYIDEVYVTGDVRTTVCACVPGYDRVEDKCAMSFSIDQDFETFMLPSKVEGEVGVFMDKDGKRIPVSTGRMFYANVVVTGSNGRLTAYLDSKMRLRVSANTELRLGELLPDHMLSIESLKGMIRLDNHLSPEQAEWVRQKLGKARAWLRRATDRDTKRVRVGGATLAVRGTDFAIKGLDDGNILVRVLAGEIEIEGLIEGSRIVAKVGDTVLIPSEGGRPSLLTESLVEKFGVKWPEP